jgi:2-polyprenyl-3-methyl-5-hydroxy-6-metoxy-1,4-benzoquinol methylase
MLQWLCWHLAKMGLALNSVPSPPRHIKVRYKRHQTKADDFSPNADHYKQLATLYNEYTHWFVPRYGRFVAAAGRYYGLPVKFVLDLACGTGLVSRQLARCAESVVGLDISEAMLQEAHSRTPGTTVRYVRGDFRDFCLAETFDAAVCGTDALNYLGKPEELVSVFRCVGRHLRPGGLFAFDTLDRRFFRYVAGKTGVIEVNGERIEWHNFYDSNSRVSEDRVVLQGIVERHRRIPIEKEDVRRAAGETGLEMVENFSAQTYLFLLPVLYPLYFYPVRQFYLLRRPES